MICPNLIKRLKGYCIHCWKNHGLSIDCHDDCTQEVFCRISKSIPQKDWQKIGEQETEERREFLRAIDAVQHKTIRHLQGGKNRIQRQTLNDIVYCENDPADIAQENETQCILILCIRGLTFRQRLVLLLSLNGYNQTEISVRTGIPYKTIKDYKYKGLAKLRQNERLQEYA